MRKKRGPPVGGYNPGAFVKGADPRRANMGDPRKPWRDTLAEQLESSVPAAVKYLTDSVQDENLPDSIRMEACSQILNRRFGKPVDRQAHMLISNPQATPEQQQGDLDALSNSQLQQIASGAIQQLEAPCLNTIEGEVVEESP